MGGLKLAGTDVSNFNGHSIRAESSSKTSQSSPFLADILARDSWSSSSTWKRFYHRQIMNEDGVYQKTALVNMNLTFKQRMENWAPV